MKHLFIILVVIPLSWSTLVFADGNDSQKFEIVDVSGQVVGQPAPYTKDARTNWEKACGEWKTDAKDLNKNNSLIGISCNSPSCITMDGANSVCTSTGTYKVKIAGVRASTTQVAPPLPEAPVATPLPPQNEIVQQPPAPIVEVVPAPRPGFIWIQGYWGWSGHSHIWIPGRWNYERPGYVWVGERWRHQGHGWHFEVGRWDRR